MKMRSFLVRPRPLLGESFKGYALRVAYLNGRQNINQLCNLIGVRNNPRSFHQPDKDIHILKRLAPMVSLSETDLLKKLNSGNKSLNQGKGLISSYDSIKLKVCPACVSSQGYIHSSWQHNYITHCEIHKCKLIEKCAFCEKYLEWQGQLLESRCTNLNCQESLLDQVKSENVPLYQSSLAKLSTNQQELYLHYLFSNLLICERPYDEMLFPARIIQQELKELTPYLIQAHAMLTNSDFRHNWLNNIAPHFNHSFQFPSIYSRSLDDYFGSMEKACRNLNLTESNITTPTIKECVTLVGKLRLKSINSNVNLRHQITASETARRLQVPVSDLSRIASLGLINCISTSQSYKYRLFDSRSIVENINKRLISKASPTPADQPLIKLGELAKSLVKKGIKSHIIIKHALDHYKDNLYQDSSLCGHWYNIKVLESSFIQSIEEHYIFDLSVDERTKMYKELFKYFKTNIEEISTLANWELSRITLKPDNLPLIYSVLFKCGIATKLGILEDQDSSRQCIDTHVERSHYGPLLANVNDHINTSSRCRGVFEPYALAKLAKYRQSI